MKYLWKNLLLGFVLALFVGNASWAITSFFFGLTGSPAAQTGSSHSTAFVLEMTIVVALLGLLLDYLFGAFKPSRFKK